MIINETVPSAYKMISFDVSFLFTMVPLDYAIDLTLKRIYGDKEIEAKEEYEKSIVTMHQKRLFHF